MEALAPEVLVIAGPTASGKTAASLAIAQAVGGVIVSADAMQVYRQLNIGTAKATEAEQALVPHYGIDLVDPHERFDASDFITVFEQARATGQPVIVAGGTSLYIRSMIRGLVKTPPSDPVLRAELEQQTDLHARLSAVDPALAQRLHPNDQLRLVRGLEVFLTSGQRLSDLHVAHAAAPDRVGVLGLWFDRDDLHARIDHRVHQMVEAGYLDEVRGLIERGCGRDLKPIQSLGYRYFYQHLLDGLDLNEAIRLTQRDSRRFARKQRTWMRGLGFERVMENHIDHTVTLARRSFPHWDW